MPNLTKKLIAGAALSFALYNVYICPCDKLVKCHEGPFWGSLAVAAAVILMP
jgi:hypothetical protein